MNLRSREPSLEACPVFLLALYLSMNSRYKREFEEFKLIFIHEMIHVWVTSSTGLPPSEVLQRGGYLSKKDPGHGELFEDKRKQLSRKLKVEIPRYDQFGGELSDNLKSTARSVIVWETNDSSRPSYYTTVFPLKLLKTKGVKGFKEYIEFMEPRWGGILVGWRILTSNHKSLIDRKVNKSFPTSLSIDTLFRKDFIGLMDHPKTKTIEKSK